MSMVFLRSEPDLLGCLPRHHFPPGKAGFSLQPGTRLAPLSQLERAHSLTLPRPLPRPAHDRPSWGGGGVRSPTESAPRCGLAPGFWEEGFGKSHGDTRSSRQGVNFAGVR